MTLRIIASTIALTVALAASAQQSVSSGVSRRSGSQATERRTPGRPARAATTVTPSGDHNLQWLKVVYRHLDLRKPQNAALYYPEMPVDGRENLFTTMLRLAVSGEAPAYEYMDGHEAFNDSTRLNVTDMLTRFHIPYTEGKSSGRRGAALTVEAADIPSAEVLGYYIIERWELDRRTSRMRTRVDALCPVLHRTEEFGQEAVRYPMFWMRYADLEPYLTSSAIFTDDDNNLAVSTYHDYFTLGLYDGEIYKTLNLRGKSMAQLYPDPEELAHAQDSIDRRLRGFEAHMWVPSLEELERRAELAAQAEAEAESDSTLTVSERKGRTSGLRGKPAKKKASKVRRSSSRRSTPAAVRSVRDRKGK